MLSLRVMRANGDWESYWKKGYRVWKVTLLITPNGKLKEAIDAYENFIEYAPPQYAQQIERVRQDIRDLQSRRKLDADIHNSRGVVFAAKGQFDDAIEAYRQALDIKPDFAEVHYNMGIVFVDKGRFDDAIKAYGQAIAIKPDYADAHYNMGIAFKAKGQIDDAIKAYRQTLSIKSDDAEAHYNIAISLVKIGRFKEAIEAFKNYVKYAPSHDAQRIEQVRQIIQNRG